MASKKNMKESTALPTNSKKQHFEEIKSTLTEQLIREKNETDEQFESRKRALQFKQINAFKELILQDVSKNTTNRTFTQYTKSLIKSYLQNPYSYKDAIREVSRYLWRVSTLYKKIILYYATMPTYYYNITQKIDFTKDFDLDKSTKNYQMVLKRHQVVDFKHEFTAAIALAIRDGIWASFIYDNEDDGIFMFYLDPQYIRIHGKNEIGIPVISFDATYFTKGSNSIYVLGVNGDTSGCWDQVFIDGYNEYLKDNTNNRWFDLPPERTLCLFANLDDEFDLPLPFFSGIFTSLLDCLDYEQIVADKTALENYVLLVSKIPLIDGDTVDDFKISLEMVQAMQELIDAVVPSLIGTAYSPMDLEVVSFKDVVNTTADTDALTKSVSNIFNMAGPPQLVVSGGAATTATAIKQAIANDFSQTCTWLERLEFEWNYYIKKNISEDYMFKFHKQSVYYNDEYISRLKDASTLGVPPMDYMTALGSTPYEAWCKLQFEKMLGIRDLMIPLQSSYTSNIDGEDTEKNIDDLSPEGERTRSGDKNDTQNNG